MNNNNFENPLIKPKANEEEISEEKNKDPETALGRIRKAQLGQKIIKLGAAATLLAGLNTPLKAETMSPDKEKEKKEMLENSINPSPESYDAYLKIKKIPRAEQKREERLNSPLNAFLEDMQYSESISLMTEEQSFAADYVEKLTESLKQEYQLSKLDKSSPGYLEALKVYETNKGKVEEIDKKVDDLQTRAIEIQEDKQNVLKDNRLKEIFEKAPDIISKVEAVRNDLIKTVSESQYLKKLQEEFNCSLKEAKEHQATRINNLKNVEITFKSSGELLNPYGGTISSSAYYNTKHHNICLPYDIPEEKIVHFAAHELIHSITMAEKGLSAKTKDLLNSSFKESEIQSSNFNEYLSRSSERYVRLKMLERELDDLGIKKMGEKITKKGYSRMMKWLKEQRNNEDNSYANDNFHLLETTKGLDDDEGTKEINNLFEKIASNDINGDTEKGETYSHSGWDYNNPNNVS